MINSQHQRSPLQGLDSNQSTYRSQNCNPKDSIYNIQFQISKQKIQTVPDMQKENNHIFMSPKNMKLKTQQLQSPIGRSPILTRKEFNTYQSPYNYSLHKANSPTKIQNIIIIKEEIENLRHKNLDLQKLILNLETQVQRCQSKTLKNELQQKIDFLTQLNCKLKEENNEQIHLQTINQLQETIYQQQETKIKYENKLKQLQEQINQYDINKITLDKNNSTDIITQLILDLEERVHNLIIENANLNKTFNEKIKMQERFNTLELEIKQSQINYQKSKLEQRVIKKKYNQLLLIK